MMCVYFSRFSYFHMYVVCVNACFCGSVHTQVLWWRPQADIRNIYISLLLALPPSVSQGPPVKCRAEWSSDPADLPSSFALVLQGWTYRWLQHQPRIYWGAGDKNSYLCIGLCLWVQSLWRPKEGDRFPETGDIGGFSPFVCVCVCVFVRLSFAYAALQQALPTFEPFSSLSLYPYLQELPND